MEEPAMLTRDERDELANMLRQRRRALFDTVAIAETDLDVIATERESEIEERAQAERRARVDARLDDRGKREIDEIDAALRRIAEGRYGVCARCAEPIPLDRLRAAPDTLHCIDCATTPAASAVESESGTASARALPLPADLALLSDRELEETLREQIRADERIDAQELRVVCRHGSVHLSGALPSERQHQDLLKLLTDENGLTDIDDRLSIVELLWSREDRTRAPEPAPEVLAEVSPAVAERYELVTPKTTDDIAESTDEDLEYVPPDHPTADEE
jgi:RNA polymerase-binding protein DksA